MIEFDANLASEMGRLLIHSPRFGLAAHAPADKQTIKHYFFLNYHGVKSDVEKSESAFLELPERH
jgi:hypothetical protein